MPSPWFHPRSYSHKKEAIGPATGVRGGWSERCQGVKNRINEYARRAQQMRRRDRVLLTIDVSNKRTIPMARQRWRRAPRAQQRRQRVAQRRMSLRRIDETKAKTQRV